MFPLLHGAAVRVGFPFRYYRMLVREPSSGETNRVGLSSLQLYSVVSSGPNLAVEGNGVASASGHDPDYPPEDAFKGGFFTGWVVEPSEFPAWLQWDFGAGTYINAYSVASFPGSNEEDQHMALRHWTMQGSYDGVEWVDLSVVNLFPDDEWSPSMFRNYSFLYPESRDA